MIIEGKEYDELLSRFCSVYYTYILFSWKLIDWLFDRVLAGAADWYGCCLAWSDS
jgi:hypothetical protein